MGSTTGFLLKVILGSDINVGLVASRMKRRAFKTPYPGYIKIIRGIKPYAGYALIRDDIVPSQTKNKTKVRVVRDRVEGVSDIVAKGFMTACDIVAKGFMTA